MNRGKRTSPIICKCNEVDQKTIEEAMENGCDTLNKIFDATSAGVGPCGGSCRKILKPMLDRFLEAKKKKEEGS